MYKRRHFIELKSRLLENRNKIQVLSGPRQIGKSTLVKQVLKEIDIPYLLVSADDVSSNNSNWITETWSTARSIMKVKKYDVFILVIDEIHKIKNWSETVKKEWDADTFNDLELRVVILGSSRLLIRDGLTESLTGRYELIRMSHWSYDEMRDAFGFDLEHYIYYGGYPGGVSLRGIVLTGGGCLLYGLEELIEEKTGINTMTAEDPMTAVAIGTGKYVEFIADRKDKR